MGQFALTDRWAIDARLDRFSLSYDHYSGDITSMAMDVLYQPFRHVGFGLGYRAMFIDLTSTTDKWTGELNRASRGRWRSRPPVSERPSRPWVPVRSSGVYLSGWHSGRLGSPRWLLTRAGGDDASTGAMAGESTFELCRTGSDASRESIASKFAMTAMPRSSTCITSGVSVVPK